MVGQRRRIMMARIGVLVLAAVVAVVGLALWVSGLQAAANVAQLAALALAVPGLVVPLMAWSRRSSIVGSLKPSTIDLAREVLAGLVRDAWGREASLRSVYPPDPISVRWELTERASVMDHRQLVARGPLRFAGTSGDIQKLTEQFRSLRSGGGKTTLALQLALELAKTPGPDDPVPVILPLPSWDTERYPVLQDWLTVRLGEDYPALRSQELGGDAARALIMKGRVLPVLDGLDELTATARTAALIALNRSLRDDDQLILTSRTDEFVAAVTDAGEVLSGAAVIEPDPISPFSAASYLTICMPPGHDERWKQLLDRLRTGREAALAELTSVPLGLWLIRAVYIDARPRPDPTALLGPDLRTSDALRTHLFEKLIPAIVLRRDPSLVTAESLRPHRQWDADQATRWLALLAFHFAATGPRDRPGEIAWWRLGAHAFGRRTLARAAGLIFGSAFALAGGVAGGITGGLGFGIGCGVMSGLLGGGFVAGVALPGFIPGSTDNPLLKDWINEEPTSAYFRLRGKTHRLILLIACAVGHTILVALLSGLVSGVGIGLIGGAGLVHGAVIAVLVGLVSGATTGLAQVLLMWAEEPALTHPAATPVTSWRGDRILTSLLITLALLAVAAGSALGAHLAPGILAGAVIGFLITSMAAVLVATSPHAWLVSVAAIQRFAWSGQLPMQLMAFLDDAHRLGLLRAVGPIYQFRHAELQQYLIARYQQDAGPSPHPAAR